MEYCWDASCPLCQIDRIGAANESAATVVPVIITLALFYGRTRSIHCA